MSKKIDLSIIIPLFNEQRNVPILYSKLKKVLNKLNKKYEIIFIDDGSTDNTFEELKKLHSRDKNVRVFQFRKNLGKSDALSLGFNQASGNTLITMDGDLQDDPSEIPKFIEKLKNYDMVVGWRINRKDSALKRFFSRLFNGLTSIISGIKIHDLNCGFKAMRSDVSRTIKIYGGLHRYIPVIAHFDGYKVGEVKVKHNPRKYGESKYNISRLVKGFFDLITVNFLIWFSRKPLYLFGSIGFIFSFVGFIINVYLLYVKYILGQLIGSRPLLTLGVLLLIVGIQFFFMGLLGEMIANIERDEKRKIKKILK